MDGEKQSNTYCGCELPPKRLYDREKVYVAFNNSQAANQAGFLFHYRALGEKSVWCLWYLNGNGRHWTKNRQGRRLKDLKPSTKRESRVRELIPHKGFILYPSQVIFRYGFQFSRGYCYHGRCADVVQMSKPTWAVQVSKIWVTGLAIFKPSWYFCSRGCDVKITWEGLP